MIAVFLAILGAALIYKFALRRRKVSALAAMQQKHVCACGCGVPVKVGRTLHNAACRKRMQRRRDRMKRGLTPQGAGKLPLFPKLHYSTKQENLL